MKSWEGLTRELQEGLGESSTTSDSLWVAEKFKRIYGEHVLYSKIRDAVPDEHMDPGEEHRSLARIDWHSVLTLNYDTLLERSLGDLGSRIVTPIFEQEQLSRTTESTRLPIIHLHGHIEHASSIVLSLEDFRCYPEKKAVFLTIARQLLLQHPVLFLGFGANDPNFVAWSGWIRDHVRQQTPSWLRLEPDFGTQNDAGMEAYWAPSLQTIRYKPAQFVPLIEALGLALSPLTDEDVLDYANEIIELSRQKGPEEGFVTSLDEVEAAINESSTGLVNSNESRSRAYRVSELLKAGLQRRGLSTEMLDEYLSPSRERVEFLKRAGVVTKQGERDAAPVDDLKKRIREGMGPFFLPWLLFSARLEVYSISPSRDPDVTFDVLEEYEISCRSEQEKGGSFRSFIRSLGKETLRQKLQILGDNGTVEAGMAWLRMPQLPEQPDERSFVEMTVRELYPDRADESGAVQTESAQYFRAKGFEALVDARHSDAIVAYRRASELSIAENERTFVQYLTAASWQRLLRPGLFQRPKVPGERDRSAQDSRTAATRVRSLQARAARFELGVASAKSENLQVLARDLASDLHGIRTATPDRLLGRSRSDDLERTLDTFKKYPGDRESRRRDRLGAWD